MKNFFAGLAFAVATFTTQAAVVEFVTSSKTVHLGDEVTMSIFGTGFPASLIQGGGFDISISNVGVVQFESLAGPPPVADVTFAPVWSFSTDPGTLNLATGTVTELNFNAFPGVFGPDFAILQLKFKALALGTTDIVLTPNAFTFGTDGQRITPEFLKGEIVVVPEPATWVLSTAGLLLVAWIGVRRNQNLEG